eukprot:640099_1
MHIIILYYLLMVTCHSQGGSYNNVSLVTTNTGIDISGAEIGQIFDNNFNLMGSRVDNGQWEVVPQDDYSWFALQLTVSKDNNWHFNPRVPSFLRFTMYGPPTTETTDESSLLLTFTDFPTQTMYFTALIQLEGTSRFNNKISTGCDTSTTPTTLFSRGSAIATTNAYGNASLRREKAGFSSSYTEAAYDWEPSQNGATADYPITFLISNYPNLNQTTIQLSTPTYTQQCNFGEAFTTGEWLAFAFSGDLANQTLFFNKFDVESWYNFTDNPTAVPTQAPTSPSQIPTQSTTDPSASPTPATRYPSSNPTMTPSKTSTDPSAQPTQNPTTTPSVSPTSSPTYKNVKRQTKRNIDVDSFQFHSDNIIPLSARHNVTYKNYHLPDGKRPDGTVIPGKERKWCLTCILAWADIDATIELDGCPEVDEDGASIWNYSDVNPENPNSIYHCDTGTWRLKSSGRLADWQDTYSRFEVWEVDSRGIKWLHWMYEFNWVNRTCFFKNEDDETIEECEVLPLTNSSDLAAYFEFTMPKRWGDARNAPLIAVWYDLLSIPYAVRPELGYEYVNLTFSPIKEGDDFGIEDAFKTFQPAIVATGILFVCFVGVMLLACFLSSDKKTKTDFMIDTRNLKTTFKHTPETIIVPGNEIESRARFSCARHGPWLLVVLVARLMYMFIFTFTFFWVLFQTINKEHFDTLASYDQFALERDTQLKWLSGLVEVHYTNESDRMERALQFRQSWCFNAYINETLIRFVDGGKGQQEYHTEQMNNPFGNITVNISSLKAIFVLSTDTACNPSQTEGAIVWITSKQAPISYVPLITVTKLNATDNTTNANATYYTIQEPAENATILDATGYDTSFSNFSEIESVLGPICDKASWCYGWGFTNAQNGEDAYYNMYNEMAEPALLEGTSGICYGASQLDKELAFLKFNASFFDDYSETLNEEYIQDFQSYAADMYDTMSGLWRAINDIPDAFNDSLLGFAMTFNVNPNYNYSDNADYGLNMGYDNFAPRGNTKNGTLAGDIYLDLNVLCPNCPRGNFTEHALQFATAFLFNGSNISDFTNMTELPVNVSNLVSINTALIDLPDLPTIELPFDFDFPIDLQILAEICISLDLLLLIYRWYRTTGIVARIVRGKDIDVSLRYLMVAQAQHKCCYGRSLIDYCLNCVIFCHDKLYRLSYNLWKIFFWVWWLLKIMIVALLILMLYYLVDQILTVEFIEGIGTFQLMTVGIGAQRSVRNQVLCTTALGYNNYTLTNLDQSVGHYAQERNDDAWTQNVAELQRVGEWNVLFCNSWVAYQTVARPVTSESPDGVWVNLNSSSTTQEEKNTAIRQHQGTYYTYDPVGGNVADPTNLFDEDTATSWRPYEDPGDATVNQDVTFDFYLSPIYMTDALTVGWDLVQVTLSWRFEFDDTNIPAGDVSAISYDIHLQGNDSAFYLAESASYEPEVVVTRQSVSSHVQYITFPNEIDTRRMQLIFKNVDIWGTEYRLNDITIAGHAPESQVACPVVDFRFWEFDASPTKNENASHYFIPEINTYYDADGTYIEYCPQVTPIHGFMYRGFVRTWLNEQLIEGHRPFILALRNIALSPFFIAIGLIGVLFMAYLFAFITEWFLMKLDLYRENPYARVPLVTTSYEDYDVTEHEWQQPDGDERTDVYGIATVGEDYYNPTVEPGDDEQLANEQRGHKKHVQSRDDIELGLTKSVTARKSGKKQKKRRRRDSSDSDSSRPDHARKVRFE